MERRKQLVRCWSPVRRRQCTRFTTEASAVRPTIGPVRCFAVFAVGHDLVGAHSNETKIRLQKKKKLLPRSSELTQKESHLGKLNVPVLPQHEFMQPFPSLSPIPPKTKPLSGQENAHQTSPVPCGQRRRQRSITDASRRILAELLPSNRNASFGT